MASSASEHVIGGRKLRLSNLDKVLYPSTGFTKGQVIDYYVGVAPVMLGHLVGRPITLKRYPNGVEASFFYEKQCPKHKPDWMRTIPIEGSRRVTNYCVIEDVAGLAWLGNLASIEVHPLLSRESDLVCPTKITFDLDPGLPATVVDCCEVALELRELLVQLNLESYPKTSGSKGLHVDVPLDGGSTYAETKQFAHAIARLMEQRMPDRVVSRMDKSLRTNKVFIDWSQNDDSKTTVAAYSLRAREQQTVSTPVTWTEVSDGAEGVALSFMALDVLARVDKFGDLHAGVETSVQALPALA